MICRTVPSALFRRNQAKPIEQINDGHRYSKQDFELCSLIPSDSIRVQGVQKMFADYAAGAHQFDACGMNLTGGGIRTGRGRVFTAATIHAMLENQAYTGDCVYNKRTESKWHRHRSAGSIATPGRRVGKIGPERIGLRSRMRGRQSFTGNVYKSPTASGGIAGRSIVMSAVRPSALNIS